jgi:hypothetical protein
MAPFQEFTGVVSTRVAYLEVSQLVMFFFIGDAQLRASSSCASPKISS